jgi:hypothetical protein
MKPQRTKEHRLADVVDKGQRIATFLGDPAVANFLDDVEAHALQSLEVASLNISTTPDAIRAAAIRYNVIKDLRRYLNGAAADGERVLRNLSEI